MDNKKPAWHENLATFICFAIILAIIIGAAILASPFFNALIYDVIGIEPANLSSYEEVLFFAIVFTGLMVYKIHVRLDNLEHSINRIHERLDLIIFKDD